MARITVRNRHNYTGQGVYIGRGTVWGNKAGYKPHKGVEVLTKDRHEAVEWYKQWLKEQWMDKQSPVHKELVKLVMMYKAGKGIDLICSCAPLECHGDVIKWAVLKIADQWH